jgi:hypothetical protein
VWRNVSSMRHTLWVLIFCGFAAGTGVWAQGASGAGRPVTFAPGSAVIVANPVFTVDGGTVTVLSAPSFTTALLAGTEVGLVLGTQVGLTPGSTVSLSGASLDSLTGGVCEVFDRHWQSIGSSAVVVPLDGGTPGRTSIHLTNRDGTREMTCGTNTTPTFGAPGLGHWIGPNGGVLHLPVRDVDVVSCVADTAGGTNNLVINEEICTASGG